jgi:hypothetical protein
MEYVQAAAIAGGSPQAFCPPPRCFPRCADRGLRSKPGSARPDWPLARLAAISSGRSGISECCPRFRADSAVRGTSLASVQTSAASARSEVEFSCMQSILRDFEQKNTIKRKGDDLAAAS